MIARFALWLLQALIANRRKPDLVIGGDDNPYMRRWYVWPRNRICNLYLHNILRDDDDRALHDHPWANASWILDGGYFESLPDEDAPARFRRDGAPQLAVHEIYHQPGSVIIRLRPTQAHRLVLRRRNARPVPAWTLFMTGPTVRQWGFHCKQGWVHWRQFTAGPHGETVGLGCEQDWDALKADNDNAADRARKAGAA